MDYLKLLTVLVKVTECLVINSQLVLVAVLDYTKGVLRDAKVEIECSLVPTCNIAQ